MADDISEQISALVDGETRSGEGQFALRRLAQDVDLKARWQRYHLISDAMKNNLPERMNTGFADSVMKALADEVAPTGKPALNVGNWKKPAAGFAVAAAIAAVSVLGVQVMQLPGAVQAPMAVLDASPSQILEQASQPGFTESGDQVLTAEELNDRLNNYVASHSAWSSMSNVNSAMPYVRRAGYESAR